MHYRKSRTKRASARAACRRFASRIGLGCSRENDSPVLIHALQPRERVAVRLRETQPHKQNPAAAESRTASANRNFRARKAFERRFPDSLPTRNVQRRRSNVQHSITWQLKSESGNPTYCQGGDSNSRPTPKAFGAALPLQMVNCEFGIFLPL